MRFGFALPHYDTSFAGRPASWDAIRAAATTAESTGFDSVWVSDHLFLDWGKYGGRDEAEGSFECWTTMTAVAAVTERVRVGSLTLCNDFRNPAILAKMAATLDLLCGARLDIGLGAGWYEPEYEAAGIPFDRPARRIKRLGEAAAIVARLLEGEVLEFDGEFYKLDGALCRPRPVQRPRPPIWIGGKGDLLLDTVAKVADGWNWSWLGSLATYRDRCAAADRACEANDRDPATLRRSVGVYLLAGSDDPDALRRFTRLADRTPAGVLQGTNQEAEVSWDAFRRDRVAGTVGEVVDRIGELVDLGVEEVIVSLGALPFQIADLEDIELVGTEVAGAFRTEVFG
ncbi:MAG TPA: LLM class flavin-dependent oxidoreductase [Actinomycetota bacterium]|nr:LLM class flavin-dependent oxidoreductase [Actinomycetota bacterium]